jgi:hypothetical protein
MKKVILIIIIILIFFFTIYNNKIYENYENINIDIGNTLSDYYYNLVLSILEKRDFNYSNNSHYYNSEKINNNNKFINEFPQHIPFDKNIYNEFIKNNITTEILKQSFNLGFWTTYTKEQENIHKIMKSTMNNIMNKTFIKLKLNKEVKETIIHFRCADVPFNKHGMYYFQKYSFFNKALQDIEQKIGKINNVIILSCTDHLSNEENKNACNIYADLFKTHLSKYNPKILCNTNVDDFVLMFYAPAVISTISSFSFMSGYFGNGIYIQPNLMDQNEEKCLDCNNTYKGYNIQHNKVNDYHNIDEVYKLLIE